MRQKIIKILKPLDGIAVENPIFPGTPDVNYIDGWIELKWVREWPIKPESIVPIKHYTPQQKLWIRRRHTKGGKVFLLIQVKREWLLIKHPATMTVGKMTREELIQNSFKYWDKGLNVGEFLECLK